MSNLKKTSADHVDIHRRLLFLSILLLSLIFAVKTGFYFVDEEMNRYLGIAGKSLFVLFAIVLVITIYWKLRFIPRSERYHLLTTTDSYANQMMNQAFKISWILTLILLFLITSMINKDSSALPAQFYLDLSVFLMLATFSVSFFILFGVGDNEKHQKAGL